VQFITLKILFTLIITNRHSVSDIYYSPVQKGHGKFAERPSMQKLGSNSWVCDVVQRIREHL